MTRARYKTEVKLFALNERAEGKGWQIIRQRIQERFNVPPPTVRAMEKWQKKFEPGDYYRGADEGCQRTTA